MLIDHWSDTKPLKETNTVGTLQTDTLKEDRGPYTVCEFNEVYDRSRIEVGRKMAVAAKLSKNREMKPQVKQTEVEDKKKGLTKQESKQNHIYRKLKTRAMVHVR